MRKLLSLLISVVGLFGSVENRAAANTFPESVINSCEFTWSDKGRGFVVGQFNVLIDLKNYEGKLEERAYIYIDCTGHSPKLNKPPYFDFANTTTSCMGVRITSLDKPALKPVNVFPIRSDGVEVKSKPSDSKLVLVWEDASTFEIESGKSFSWTMKSKLSAQAHRGVVSCK